MKRGGPASITLIFLLAIIGGGGAIAIKYGAHAMPPFTFVFLRFLLALLFLLPILMWKEKKIEKPSWRLVLVVSFGALNVILFVIGIPYTNAAVSQVLYALGPVLATIFSLLLLKDFPSVQRVLGIVVGFLGAITTVLLAPNYSSNSLHSAIWGNAVIFIAVFFQAMYTVGSKPFQAKHSALYTTTMFVLVGMLISTPLMIGEFKIVTFELLLQPYLLVALLYSALMSTLVYYFVYQVIVYLSSPVHASLTLYLQPMTAYIIGYFLFGETLDGVLLIAACVTILGALLVIFDRSKSPDI